jgi:hypothetical protein
MRFVLKHPSDHQSVAEYGFCPRFGYWIELWRRGDCRPWLTYELGEPNYDATNPLHGALHFLAEHTYLDAAEAEAVIVNEHGRERARDGGRAAEVLRNFREASGE